MVDQHSSSALPSASTSTILPTRIVRKMALPALTGVEAAKRLAAYAAVDRHVLKGSKVRQGGGSS